jgi:DNA-binding MarR family transcriptional regulator
MNAHSPSGSGYWYGPDDRLDPPGAVLQALRDYRNAEVARRRSTRDSMGMGETDLLALRYLLRARANGERVGPKDLSRSLGITTASTTSLIDRLVGSGHHRREPHPTHPRTREIKPTATTDSEERATLGDMHRRMMAVAEELSAEEARTVVSFLRRMSEAVTEPPQHPAG